MFAPLFAYFMFVPLAATDFLRGPNWASVEFLSPPFRWALGVILALVILYAIIKAALAIGSLAGADRNKAKYAGEIMAFAAAAIVLALMFQDLFGSLIRSVA